MRRTGRQWKFSSRACQWSTYMPLLAGKPLGDPPVLHHGANGQENENGDRYDATNQVTR